MNVAMYARYSSDLDLTDEQVLRELARISFSEIRQAVRRAECAAADR
jgi:hypothetical protein